jgi:hypothetical protein
MRGVGGLSHDASGESVALYGVSADAAYMRKIAVDRILPAGGGIQTCPAAGAVECPPRHRVSLGCGKRRQANYEQPHRARAEN